MNFRSWSLEYFLACLARLNIAVDVLACFSNVRYCAYLCAHLFAASSWSLVSIHWKHYRLNRNCIQQVPAQVVQEVVADLLQPANIKQTPMDHHFHPIHLFIVCGCVIAQIVAACDAPGSSSSRRPAQTVANLQAGWCWAPESWPFWVPIKRLQRIWMDLDRLQIILS